MLQAETERAAGKCVPWAMESRRQSAVAGAPRGRLFTSSVARVRRWRDPEGWNEFVAVVAGLAFILACGVFVHLAISAPRGDYLPLEDTILQAFRQPGTDLPLWPEWASSAVRDITALGSAMVIILLTLMIIGYLLLTRRIAAALILIVATAGGQAMNATLKHLFGRERPEATLHLVEVRSPSFPSGHSMAASIFYLTTGALLTQTAKRRREKMYLIAAVLLVTVLIGFSRVYLGVHYPTDVVAGWCAGVAWAIVCWALARRMRRRGQLEPAPA